MLRAVAEPDSFWIEVEGSGSGRCEVLDLVDLDDTAELIVDEVRKRLLAADLARKSCRAATQLVMDRRQNTQEISRNYALQRVGEMSSAAQPVDALAETQWNSCRACLCEQLVVESVRVGSPRSLG